MNVKTNNVKTLSIEDLIIGQALLQVMQDKIKENGHEVPSELATDIKAISSELDERLQADRERQLKVLEMRRLALSTIDEKRARLDTEIAALRGKLGVTP